MARLVTLNSPLPDFLRAQAATPFVDGGSDCVLMACDWVRQQRKVDPARRWRGAYATRLEALRIIAAGGGLEALAVDAMAEAGLAETSDPMPGDIGVVAMQGETVMAIRTWVAWATKTRRGLVVDQAAVLRAWTV